MPKLLLSGAGRQVIINRENGAASLINILTSVAVTHKPGMPIPADNVHPFDWGFLTVWMSQDEDGGRSFEQRNTIFKPGGEPLLDRDTDGVLIDFGSNKTAVNTMVVQGFPVGQEGTVIVTVEIRERGKNQEWQLISESPIEVMHQLQEDASI